MNKIYSGIGSRKTPDNVLSMMTAISCNLEECGFRLRSGGAPKADTAFESGIKDSKNKDIFLPWKGFNKNQSQLYTVSKEALNLASVYHPNWNNCSRTARLFHGRNCYQVLGLMLDEPSDFVLCYTPNGAGSGGTGQAIRIATALHIPIFDFGKGIQKTHDNFLQHLISLGIDYAY